MTETPISILQKAADLGLKLSVKGPDTLRIEASRPWPKEFADVLTLHKQKLIALLQLSFVMVHSRALDEILFFCVDQATKTALVDAGASEWGIYTREELKILVEQDRTAPLSAAELRKVHEIRRSFSAKARPEER